MRESRPRIDREAVVRLWLMRQGLIDLERSSRGRKPLDAAAFVAHLENAGGLQLDSVNVVDRAHYLTLWSRFGVYDRDDVDRWVWRDRLAYEYWGHEASILPISHLPLGRRRMRRFPPPSWQGRAWWERYSTSVGSKRRVLRRIREEGPLESADFSRRKGDTESVFGAIMPLTKEDTRTLKLLWHDGRLAVHERRHFRCVYDLAENVYPHAEPASVRDFEDSWLLRGLHANGAASEAHLVGYFTDTDLKAADRRRILDRNLRSNRVIEVEVEGHGGAWFVLAEDLEALRSASSTLAEPRGTTLLSPFDSLLWQRRRAEALLDFAYRVEIYVPPAKRRFGYYAMPIFHDGRLVGQVDPKLDRAKGVLAIKKIGLEPGFAPDRRFESGLAASFESLRRFLGADSLTLPRGWKRRLA